MKIDNTDAAHPQYGVDQADVVYEEVVEGGITRLAAIFNSHDPDRVGPVRSVRKTDQSLVWPIGGVFAYSGGAQYAIDSINTAPVVQLDETRAGPLMFRDHSRRRAVQPLRARRPDVQVKCGHAGAAAAAVHVPRRAHATVGGDPVDVGSTSGSSAGFAVTWTWDAASGTWKRSIFGEPERRARRARTFAPKNVVVMFVPYVGGDPGTATQGRGRAHRARDRAWVFTGGQGRSRARGRGPTRTSPRKLLERDGQRRSR